MLDTRVPDRDASLRSASGLVPGWIGVTCPRELVRTAPPSTAPPDALTARHAAVLGVRCGPGLWQGVVEPSLAGSEARMPAGRPV